MGPYDCRSIKGIKCKYLIATGSIKFGKIPYIYYCNKLHITIFPDINNKFKTNEEVQSITPDFNCPYVQKLRKQKLLPGFEMRINPDKSFIHWNQSNLKTW